MFWGSSSSHDVGTELQNSKCHVVGGELSVFASALTLQLRHSEPLTENKSEFVILSLLVFHRRRCKEHASRFLPQSPKTPKSPLHSAVGEH